MKYAVRRHRHRIIFFLLFMVVAGGLLFAWRTFIGEGGEVASVDEQSLGQITGRPSPKVVTSRTLSFGSIYLAGSVDEAARNTNKRFQYPLGSLEEFGRQDYEAWITSLACPLTDNEAGGQGCHKDYAAELKKWFTVVALGSSHLGNQGEDVFRKTKENLEANGVQYTGSYNSDDYEGACEIVNLPARYTLNDSSYKEATMPLVVCSIDASNSIPQDLLLDEIRSYAQILPVWTYIHSSVGSGALDQQIYRAFIDAGASVVVGDHSDSSDRLEAYKGKLIVYSLGPAVGESGSTTSFALGMEISAQLDQSVLLWTRLSPECAKFKDNCIETAAAQGLTLPKYQYKFSLIGIKPSDSLIAEPLDSLENSMLKDELGWEKVVAGLRY